MRHIQCKISYILTPLMMRNIKLIYVIHCACLILGGFTGLFSMFGAYQRWCRTTSTRVHFYEKMLDMCGLIEDPDSPKAGRHRELERAEIRKSEEAVVNTMAAICSFSNPFISTDKEHLYRYIYFNC